MGKITQRVTHDVVLGGNEEDEISIGLNTVSRREDTSNNNAITIICVLL